MKPMARWAALAIGLVALALPAAAVADSAAPGPLTSTSRLREVVRERAGKTRGGGQPSQLAFKIETGRGYVVEVFGSGNAVAIDVVRGDGHSSTAYVARGIAGGDQLRADFGNYGKVSMRFRPSRHATPAKSGQGCDHGGKPVSRSGVFVGEFRFRGEGGYLDLDARRARGKVIGVAPKCARQHSSSQAQESVSHPETEGIFGPETPFLEAGWRHGVRSAEVGAFFLFGAFSFYADVEESRGRMAIFRHALVTARSHKMLRANNALTSARLSPPPPFSGSGIYTAGPDGKKTWTGSLAVNFPGAPHYPLTGPPFKVTLDKE
jgi:hypothetical protein